MRLDDGDDALRFGWDNLTVGDSLQYRCDGRRHVIRALDLRQSK